MWFFGTGLWLAEDSGLWLAEDSGPCLAEDTDRVLPKMQTGPFAKRDYRRKKLIKLGIIKKKVSHRKANLGK